MIDQKDIESKRNDSKPSSQLGAWFMFLGPFVILIIVKIIIG